MIHKNSARFISTPVRFFWIVLSLMMISRFSAALGSVRLSPEENLGIRRIAEARISPDEKWIAYTIFVPRTPGDGPGGSYRELHVLSMETGESRPFIAGKVSAGSIQWTPDGSAISFLTRRGGSESQVWTIALSGGEARQITQSPTSVSSYRWAPSGKAVAYLAETPETEREKELQRRGYDFIFYEENWKHQNLFIQNLEGDGGTRQVTSEITVWDFEFSPDGRFAAAAVSPKNLVDFNYMFQKIHIINLETGEMRRLTENPGKLGNFAFSPDGKKIVYTAALERKDHAVSQVFVVDVSGENLKNLTIPEFRGHVQWAGWKDDETIVYIAAEGVWNTLNLVPAAGGDRRVILDSRTSGIIFDNISYTRNFRTITMLGESPNIPRDLFSWNPGGELRRMTRLNPWLDERALGRQEVVRYKARDGMEIEGILVYPVGIEKGSRVPLIVSAHGGPEDHYTNGWMSSSYILPSQVLAGKGYAVFHPNYRSSTGYGVKFGLAGYEDPAGREFDDLADGIDFLVREGIADGSRVGLGGISYGGYAAAWFGTYYTKYVRAVCAFVGITDLISRQGTLDIPYEELYVHSGKPLEETWMLSLKRSPIYYARQSRTAVLIMGGTDDTRVHPSQSLELYRRLKMNNHPAVRLVQYPGEGHGNGRQPGRIDFLQRHLQWFDWYVRDKKPLDGPMPPLDISDSYGIPGLK